jgi:predicted metal-dependent peptidase
MEKGRLTAEETEQWNKVKQLAAHIIRLASDSIVVNLRFLDVAVSALSKEPRMGLGGVATDSRQLYYDPVWILQQYEKEPAFAMRMYLHVLLHCIFYHSYQYGKLDAAKWDLAADLAVENTILELGVHGTALKKDDRLREAIGNLKAYMNGKGSEEAYAASVSWNQNGSSKAKKKKKVPFTAEHIYRYLQKNEMEQTELAELIVLSHVDEHSFWKPKEEMTIGQEQFQRISERIKADLKSFSKGKTKSESLDANLGEATREHYDYSDILKRFTCLSEDMSINEDEFDYIYYTYGLSEYGNMPLVEPLEYKDVKKVKEFVIVIDTSASCKGPLVQAFLRKTYAILKQSENFFHQINVHIIQCDREVQSDTKITCDEDFDAFLASGKLRGFGSTDFRPAFSYVDEQIAKGEFENLKGLIYFTDGYGIYPDRMPEYDTIFVFLNEDEQKPEVPVWAIEVVLGEPELETFEEKENRDEH